MKEPIPIEPCDMQLADVVRQLPITGPFSAAVVIKIRDGYVTLFRPYATTCDFSMGDSTIPYIGIEEYRISFNNACKYELLERRSRPLK